MSPKKEATGLVMKVAVAPENPSYKEATAETAKGKCEDCERFWPYTGNCAVCGGFVNAV